ncbi:DNA/RNA non-specific endonuclease [Virgibacillus dakarensis]|uniref:DNA/RNA non-specific endonuclease n=1 Tax=Virgibacillus dakarensis TaxID=1917889 RepID=UPI00389B33DD
MQTNDGKSIDAWNQRIDGSTDEIKKYKTQVDDLLSLFENYVTDTTAYISPIARNTIMRVDRNDIWANLNQVESGVTSNVTKALNISYQSPASLFGLFEDPTDAQKEASAFNKRQLESIQSSIQSTQTKLQNKMDDLWDLYNTKVKPFENADDAYNDLAANIKSKYTSFFEGLWDVAETIGKGAWDLVNGLIDGVLGMITGLLTVAGDLGIIVLSGVIPNPIEPAFLRDKAEETADSYQEAVVQFVKDPMRAVESVAQSFTDSVEEKGIMYVTGSALPAVIPSTWALKGVKAVSKLKGAGKSPNVAGSKFPYSKEFIQNKINAAKEKLGKVPWLHREVVSTGFSRHSVYGVKPLSEVHPQLFAVKGEGNGRGNSSNTNILDKKIKEVEYGKHYKRGKYGRRELAPNVKYVTEDGYKYRTDELGRIVDVNADNLILKEAKRNKRMQRVVGRQDRLPDDDGGHLIGSQFHGSGDIDNLVAQNSQINRSGGEWYKMETEWANALKEIPPKKVFVKIKPIYSGHSLRPDSFKVVYEIEGKGLIKKTIENQSGG